MAGVNGQFVKSPSLLTGLGKPPRHRDSPGEDLSGDRPDLEAGRTTARTATLPNRVSRKGWVGVDLRENT